MEEDLPASWGSRAASEWSGGPSQALAGLLRVPIQLWVLGLEIHAHKIITWHRGFEPPDLGSALRVVRIRIRAQALHHLPGLLDQSCLENKS